MMHDNRRSYLQVAMGLTQLVLLLQYSKSTEAFNISKPGCPDRCGEFSIPYPFGIGPNCSMSEDFDITCDEINDSHMNISLSSGELRVKIYTLSFTCGAGDHKFSSAFNWSRSGTQIWLNNEKNKFVAFGCNTLAYLKYNTTSEDNIWGDYPDNSSVKVGCLSTCLDVNSVRKYGKSCTGVGCCHAAIPYGITDTFSLNFDDKYNHSEVSNFNNCSYAMLTADDPGAAFDISYIISDKPINRSTPVVVNWAIGNTDCTKARANKISYACKSIHSECFNVNTGKGVGYLCNCSKGYEGNPYLEEGCQDINECAATKNPCPEKAKCHNFPGGYDCSCPSVYRKVNDNCELKSVVVVGIIVGICVVLLLCVLLLCCPIHVVIKRRNLSKIKEKYFQQYGGWILLEKIKSNQGFGFMIFSKQQIEQATNNFDRRNIIGHGGQGTVYKGTLSDQIVAIKKCKIISESKKKEFGKEMLILSQISHKNIVKLLGCCLEVEVPILVYEFIPNGTLFHYIHNKNSRSHISLTTRLRIAHESAEALAYLHTSASPPIFHGDVKSSNILLDQNYTGKVSDFGASILAPTEEQQFVTLVQGTCGYLDPEYMQSCQLTDKSDVYSFGVVLLELLTSRPVIDFDLPEEERSLSSRFISAMKENKLQELLDNEINNEDDMELITEVAQLAMECLSMKGDERPIMKEVAEELHRIIKLKQHSCGQEQYPAETTSLLGVRSGHDIESEHSSYYFNVDKEAQESIAFGR